MIESLNLSIVGATGAVGAEVINLLQSRPYQLGTIRLFASERSRDNVIPVNGREISTEIVRSGSFSGSDFVIFGVGAEQSRTFAPQAVAEGAVVVDNSSAFRMDPKVPLVVPEINIDAVRPDHKIIANPNCCTIIMLMAVAPLAKLGKIKRLIVSTYQSASGAGAAAMAELEQQTRDVLAGKEPVAQVLPHVFAFNVFNHDSEVGDDGYNGEETKMVWETRKIMGDPDILVNPTCVRVPILRAHSESITIEFEGPAPSVEAAREAISAFPGVKLVDDREKNVFPMPIDASGKDDVLVGRIRQDISNPNALSLFVTGDQLRKGAALNALQIVEALAERAAVKR